MLEHAITLLSQQCWCWGRDTLRPSGNWLLETGFERLEPPPELKDCSSVYRLTLPDDAIVILRGFGVLFERADLGAVFLPRYQFAPRYSRNLPLASPPWTDTALIEMDPPANRDRIRCASLLLSLLDWIRQYEVDVVKRLGLKYRRQTLAKWDDGNRYVIPVERFASEWRRLSLRIAANVDCYCQQPTVS